MGLCFCVLLLLDLYVPVRVCAFSCRFFFIVFLNVLLLLMEMEEKRRHVRCVRKAAKVNNFNFSRVLVVDGYNIEDIERPSIQHNALCTTIRTSHSISIINRLFVCCV